MSRTDKMIAIVVSAIFICVALVAGYTYHKKVPQLRAECEARGGMLISTRGPYECVGKPPGLPASGTEVDP